MSYTDFDFPHTHFYDDDLRELISMYTTLVKGLASLKSWQTQHETDYTGILKRTTALEKEITNLANNIQKQNEYIAQQHQMIIDECNNCKRQIDNHFELVLNRFTNKFETLSGNVLAKLSQMQIQLNDFNLFLVDALEQNKAEIYEHVNDMFNYWVEHLPDYENLIIYNPARGSMTTIQEAINDLYADFNVFGLTAIQYEELSLTAEQYDNYQLTAREYDTWGYIALEYPDPRYYMIDPFTGEKSLVKNVVYKLAAFHKDGFAAEDYDALLLTAEEYDAKLITAFNYDWFAKDLLSA